MNSFFCTCIRFYSQRQPNKELRTDRNRWDCNRFFLVRVLLCFECMPPRNDKLITLLFGCNSDYTIFEYYCDFFEINMCADAAVNYTYTCLSYESAAAFPNGVCVGGDWIYVSDYANDNWWTPEEAFRQISQNYPNGSSLTVFVGFKTMRIDMLTVLIH
jgi:hypothetical protein